MSTSPIHAAWNTLISKGRLSFNPNQLALVNRFAILQQTLLENPGPQDGLYIYGEVGTGKSYLADLFYSTVPQTILKRRVHFNEFMMDIHSRLHQARSQPGYAGDPLVQIGREVKNESRLLCLDEFQVTDIADAMILKRLLTSVWDSGGVMVSTSNRHPTELYKKGLNRSLFVPFIVELQKRCEVWKMEGDLDYRTVDSDRNKSRVDVFFTSPSAFENAITSATKGESLKESRIPVMMNRSLMVDAYKTSTSSDISHRQTLIVKSTFPYLCERPLGSSDYHALCSRASTIYLSGLRQFAADELDFIRRFITLIDIAYESKTRVICLSSVPLKEVFIKIFEGSDIDLKAIDMQVKGEGGSSSSMMSTFLGEMEWSATGLTKASLATGGAGETDVRFAIGRTLSRLSEMSWASYGVRD